MSTGPIAREVVEALSNAGNAIPVRPTEAVPVFPTPGAPPTRTVPEPGSEGSSTGPPIRAAITNMAKPYSAAWWFEKGGTTGIVCLLAVALVYGIIASQKDSQDALIKQMNKSEDNRSSEAKQMIQGVLKTQGEMTVEISKVGRAIEKFEARIDRWSPSVVGPGKSN